MTHEPNAFNLRLGDPPQRAVVKLRPYLHQWVQQFIRCSPFVVLATSDGEAFCSASPRGGRPGFVRVLSDTQLLLPDEPGNQLFQSYANVSASPAVGLLFLIPGVTYTVRVSGRAAAVNGDEFRRLADEGAAGESPLQGLLITVSMAYGHCGRSLRHADLWNEETIARNRAQPPVPRREPGI